MAEKILLHSKTLQGTNQYTQHDVLLVRSLFVKKNCKDKASSASLFVIGGHDVHSVCFECMVDHAHRWASVGTLLQRFGVCAFV